eukprot:s3791_g1.t1
MCRSFWYSQFGHQILRPNGEFETVLQQIRNGSLRPDATRSGLLGASTQEDPKDTYVLPDQPSSSSDSSSSSSEEEDAEDERGSAQESFSCGVKMTAEFKRVEEVSFLTFRKFKRCATAKPVKDVGVAATTLQKRRLESERQNLEGQKIMQARVKEC